MIELTYYRHKQEDKEYKTWFYDKGNVYHNTSIFGPDVIYVKEKEVNYQDVLGGYDNGWTKMGMPKNLTKEQEIQWYIDSNDEDLYFIGKEREACFEWFMKNMNEINLAQKHNKKIQ